MHQATTGLGPVPALLTGGQAVGCFRMGHASRTHRRQRTSEAVRESMKAVSLQAVKLFSSEKRH